MRLGYDATVLIWDRDGSFERLRTDEVRWSVFRVRVKAGSPLVMALLPLWWARIFFTILLGRYDAVHAADFDTYVAALPAARLRRKPITYDICDFYANVITPPIFTARIRRALAWLDRRLVRKADAVILVDASRRVEIGLEPGQFLEIMNCVPDIGPPEPMRMDSASPLRIYYGGGIMPGRGLETIIQAVGGDSRFHVRIEGSGAPAAYAERLRALARSCSNVELSFEGVPHERILAQTRSADVIFALYDPSLPKNRFANPNKFFEGLMAGRPILASENTPPGAVTAEVGCGVTIPYGDVEAARRALALLHDDGATYRRMAEAARKAYESTYNWPAMEKRLAGLYGRLLG